MSDAAQRPLDGLLVVDLARYLPGAFASRELVRLGARVVGVEAPEGDPMRRTAPAWDEVLRRGKESVVCDLKRDVHFARALCARADVVLEGFRRGSPRGSPSGPTTCRHASSTARSRASAPRGVTQRVSGTTSTTSAGRARWPTRRRGCHRFRSPISRPERSAP